MKTAALHLAVLLGGASAHTIFTNLVDGDTVYGSSRRIDQDRLNFDLSLSSQMLATGLEFPSTMA